jgi:putative ubiquitin-RnfH superfamily antitoxin RatB of RatAB toxin-antitoxin module
MTSAYPDQSNIEVAFADPDNQKVIALTVESGTTLIDAIHQSGIQGHFPGLDVEAAPKGVFGERKDNGYVVVDQDRIEIYRELKFDPKEARRRRALK